MSIHYRYKVHKEALNTLGRLTSNSDSLLIVHYSCESFYDIPEGRTPRITSIAVRYFKAGQTKSFSIHKIAEIEGIKPNDIETCYDDLEKKMLAELFDFVDKHQQCNWLHWNMRDINYGFEAIDFEVVYLNRKEVGYIITFKEMDGKDSNTTASIGPVNGKSPAFKEVLQKCKKGAKVNVPILLLGETGTGKEVLAKYIHQTSPRKDKPFIALNCGAVQKELIGSELFGYESGTFTGGTKEGKKGKFEEAQGGTIFLDEIGEMPLDLQVHLLRVLQEKEIEKLGDRAPKKIDVRVLAATNRNLTEMISEGKFRQDLYFRLNVINISIPPLRDRREDIPELANYLESLHRVPKFSPQQYSFLARLLSLICSGIPPGHTNHRHGRCVILEKSLP